MKAKEAIKIIGDWISKETHKRKYNKVEIAKLSEALIHLKCITKQLDNGWIPVSERLPCDTATELAYEGLQKALEKQTPKKPIYKFTDSTGDMFYDCQVCGEYVTHSGTQAKKNFCSNCGQRLDWRVGE